MFVPFGWFVSLSLDTSVKRCIYKRLVDNMKVFPPSDLKSVEVICLVFVMLRVDFLFYSGFCVQTTSFHLNVTATSRKLSWLFVSCVYCAIDSAPAEKFQSAVYIAQRLKEQYYFV